MNITNVKRVLPILLNNNITPFLWGSQGVGKTETVKQYCAENKLDLRILYTATQEVGDLIGLLVKNEEDGTVYHARPEWFPTEGEGVIFLDELNRAPNDVLQSLFSFILKGTLHTHQLPPGWKVVAAGNYQNENFTTTDTSDAAWMSRFCHLDFTPSVEEWLIYAEGRGMHETAQFIREQNGMLELDAKTGGRLDTSFIKPDRRAWTEGIGKLELDGGLTDETRYEVFSGLVGPTAAASYISWLGKKEKALNLNQVLKTYNGKVRERVLDLASETKERRFDLLNQPIDELCAKIEADSNLLATTGYLENIKLFLADIPKELSTKAFVRLAKLGKFHGYNELLNDPLYVKRVVS